MNVAVIGTDYLTPEQAKTVRDVLDSFFCRYATGAPCLITRDKPGVELIAKRLANTWNWASVTIHQPESGFIWRNFRWREINNKIAEDCDVLISVYDRYPDNRNRIADKARRLNKKVIEVFV